MQSRTAKRSEERTNRRLESRTRLDFSLGPQMLDAIPDNLAQIQGRQAIRDLQ